MGSPNARINKAEAACRRKARDNAIALTISSSSQSLTNIPTAFPSPRIPALRKTRIPCTSPAEYAEMPTFAAKGKSVISGDTLVLVSNATGAERTLSLAFVTAPHLKREGDEPFAFESRDFLRKHVVGKQLLFEVLYQIPNTKREYGRVILPDGTHLPDEAVRAGWLKLREGAGRTEDTEEATNQLDKLRLYEAQARSEDKGVWATNGGRIEVQHDMGDSEVFMEQWKGKTVDGLVERVLSGDRMLVRLILAPNKHAQVMTLVSTNFQRFWSHFQRQHFFRQALNTTGLNWPLLIFSS